MSQEWIETEYANQSDPESFYSVETLADDGLDTLLVTVDGIERNPLRWTFNIQNPINGIATMRADFDTEGSPIFRPDLDAEIIVSDDDGPIFGGYITAIRERGFDGPNGEAVVYGPRRVGKSFLIDALCEAVGGFRYQAIAGTAARPTRPCWRRCGRWRPSRNTSGR